MIKDFINVDYNWLEANWLEFYRQYLSADAAAGIPHALLITGAAGVGKMALSARIACSMLCRQPNDDGLACGSCKACRMLAGGGHPDLVLLQNDEDSLQIKVDQVRELIHSLNLTAAMSGYRVALIKDAERMNTNAANALLKTLEEPGGKTVLILCSAHPGRLPATIRSRCQQLHMPLPDSALATAYLQGSGNFSDDDIRLALELAGNAPLLAAELLAEEQLNTVRNIHRQLDGLVTGGQSISAIAADWQQHDPGKCWQWVLFWLHQGITGRLQWPALVKINARQQQDLYQSALLGWRRSGSGLRHELQFQEWLLQWQSVASQAGQT